MRIFSGLGGRLLLAFSLMALLTLLPMGLLQLNAALENGYWFARSAEFMGRPIIDLLVWSSLGLGIWLSRRRGKRGGAGTWKPAAVALALAWRCRRTSITATLTTPA